MQPDYQGILKNIDADLEQWNRIAQVQPETKVYITGDNELRLNPNFLQTVAKVTLASKDAFQKWFNQLAVKTREDIQKLHIQLQKVTDPKQLKIALAKLRDLDTAVSTGLYRLQMHHELKDLSVARDSLGENLDVRAEIATQIQRAQNEIQRDIDADTRGETQIREGFAQAAASQSAQHRRGVVTIPPSQTKPYTEYVVDSSLKVKGLLNECAKGIKNDTRPVPHPSAYNTDQAVVVPAIFIPDSTRIDVQLNNQQLLKPPATADDAFQAMLTLSSVLNGIEDGFLLLSLIVQSHLAEMAIDVFNSVQEVLRDKEATIGIDVTEITLRLSLRVLQAKFAFAKDQIVEKEAFLLERKISIPRAEFHAASMALAEFRQKSEAIEKNTQLSNEEKKAQIQALQDALPVFFPSLQATDTLKGPLVEVEIGIKLRDAPHFEPSP